MTDSSATIKPRVPTYKTEGDYSRPAPEVLNGNAAPETAEIIPAFKIASAPARADTSSNSLIAAVQKVYTVVTAQIAYHEREAARLRDALKPFATLAPRPNVAHDDDASGAAIRAVLDLADRLTGEPQS